MSADILDEHWDEFNLNRFAHNGQEEDGVDILAAKTDKTKEVRRGIQCKNTNDIDINTIKDAVEEAENFKPELDEYWLLTTADLDNSIQQSTLQLSETRVAEESFSVRILFWDTLTRLFGRYPSVAENHYPQFFQNDELSGEKQELIGKVDQPIRELSNTEPNTRKILQSRAEELRDEYSDEDYYIKIRLTDVGNGCRGISVEMLDDDDWRLVSVLEDIDSGLYDDGYNTAWAYESTTEDTYLEDYKFTGKVYATPISVGVPEKPSISTTYKVSNHKNIH